MNITKSNYVSFHQCPRKYYLQTYEPDKAQIDDAVERRMRLGQMVGDYAKSFFDDIKEVSYNQDKQKMIQETKALLKSSCKAIAEASFEYNGLFCSVDILRDLNGKYYIYEVKSSSRIKKDYLRDIAFQTYVLRHCSLDIEKVYIMHIDKHYVRDIDLNLDRLFILEDVSEIIQPYLDDIENSIEDMKSIHQKPDFLPISYCNQCGFKSYCYRNLQDDSLVNLYRYLNKTSAYESGLRTLRDVYEYDHRLSPIQKRQIEYHYQDKETYIDKQDLTQWLSQLVYPLYFLDFETLDHPIPPFKGTYPNQRLPFQASIHTMNQSNGKLLHDDLLIMPSEDPRERMSQFLVDVIQKKGSVIVYNASFEKSIIRDLINQVPDKTNSLQAINDQMIDLLDVFRQGMVYDKAMEGSFSIKKVYPAICKEARHAYQELNRVHNGTEAMASLEGLPDLDTLQKKETIKDLKAYCALDTKSMVDLLDALKKMVES
jgi:CRISPR/Cas system-associated exonuclease Cas4 (RecB family)/bacterioferritin (cytochrome b1)